MNPKILVIDDDTCNRIALSKILGDNNYEFYEAASGFEALSSLSKNLLPDVILLDLMMPGMDGFETCKRIKGMENMNAVPVIFLSAVDDYDQIQQGFEFGAIDYILKPFCTNILLSKLKIHIDLKRKSKELENINQTLEEKVKIRSAELEKANNELKQLDENKAEFLKIISHEIRTPLNGIIGFTSLIKGACNNKRIEKYITLLDNSVKRLEKFSYDALLYTRLNTQHQTIQKEEIDFARMFKILIEKSSELISEKNIHVELTASRNIKVYANYDLLVHCLEKILDNAVKFTPEESKITIVIREDKNNVSCIISDEGDGFSDKALKNLFKLFVPGETFVNENEGIDLALCKLIIDAHKGSVYVKNLVKGASVELTFPKETGEKNVDVSKINDKAIRMN